MIISSLLFVAALFGKQSSLVLVPALAIYWLIGGQILRAAQQMVLIALLTAGIILIAQLSSGGYVWEHVRLIGRSHGYYYNSLRVALTAHIQQQYLNRTYLDELQRWIIAGAIAGFAVAGGHSRRACVKSSTNCARRHSRAD